MKNYILVLLILILATIAYRFLASKKEAEIVVSGPEQFEIGELIEIDATQSVAQSLQWTILPETQNFKTVGRTAFFSSTTVRPYTLIITAAYQGTLATSILTLNPKINEPKINEPKINEPNPIPEKLRELMDGGIIKTKDDFILTAKQLGIEIKEQWIEENF
jgi:hypothetical protein